MAPERTLTLAHSPDPDDAFMFYGISTGEVDCRNYHFKEILEDIETLNRRALNGELDITAASFHAYPYLADQYALLPHGASIGEGYGPIVVSREDLSKEDLPNCRVAVPGELTTAFLVARLCLGTFEYDVVPFDRIFEAVESGRCDAGIIIHEGQLTWASHQLFKVIDLGTWWQEQTGLPLPLGCNLIRKELGAETMREVSDILGESIRYGMEHRSQALQHAAQWGRDLNMADTDQFVRMYVNDYTISYGVKGKQAVRELLERAHAAGVVPHLVYPEFIEGCHD